MTWRQAFEHQAGACADLGSPFTARLLALLAVRGLPAGPVCDRITGWPGDITARGASVPLRLAGALHRLVLEKRAPRLAAQYPPSIPGDDNQLWAAIEAALTRDGDCVNQWLDTAPQTNEVGRAAFLIAAARWLGVVTGLPLVLSELGASAGLNLRFDRYALAAAGRTLGPPEPALTLAPDWQGNPPPVGNIQVIDRAGADLHPADPVADRLRLLSFIWPDQKARIARMRFALDEAARSPATVTRADAVDFLADRLARPRHAALHMVFHTIAWQYFPKDAQARGAAMLAEAGRAASRDAPIAHVAMEADDQSPGAGLTLTLWPDGRQITAGRADFHGRWIDWRAPDPETVRW